jgi:hypothetical protein
MRKINCWLIEEQLRNTEFLYPTSFGRDEMFTIFSKKKAQTHFSSTRLSILQVYVRSLIGRHDSSAEDRPIRIRIENRA